MQNIAGWSYGGANTLKRMTSIAQPRRQLLRRYHGRGLVIGHDRPEFLQPALLERGRYRRLSKLSNTPGIVTVNYVNAGNETDNIDLDASSVLLPGLLGSQAVPSQSWLQPGCSSFSRWRVPRSSPASANRLLNRGRLDFEAPGDFELRQARPSRSRRMASPQSAIA